MENNEKKKQLRRQIVIQKKQLSDFEKNKQADLVISHLEKVSQFVEAQVIMAYWAMPDELNTDKIFRQWHQKKRIILPSVDGENLKLKEFKGFDNLTEGQLFKIPEPVGADFEEINSIDLVIVQGVAFDFNLNRMGRGKGYYDKFLKQTKAYKIGICYDLQLIAQIPVNEYDVKMNCIISPYKTIF